MDSWAKIQQLPDDKLRRRSRPPDLTDRVEARKELVRRGPKARDLVLRKFVSGGLDGDGRLPALGVLLAALERGRRRPVPAAAQRRRRRTCAGSRSTGSACTRSRGDARVAEALMKALGDPEPGRAPRRGAGARPRRRRRRGRRAGQRLQADRERRRVPEGRLHPRRSSGSASRASTRCCRSPASGDKDRDLAVEAFLALRTQAGGRRAAGTAPAARTSPPAQREALVRSYTNYQFDPPMSLDPLADYLARRPNEPLEVVRAAVEVFAASGDANAPKATRLVLGLLDQPGRRRAVRGDQGGRGHAARGRGAEADRDPRRRDAARVGAGRGREGAPRARATRRPSSRSRRSSPASTPATLKVEALRTLAALDIAAGPRRRREAARPARPDAARRGGRGPRRDQARGEARSASGSSRRSCRATSSRR